MKILNIVLNNYRNYDQLKISFSKNTNIFIGDNGQGKTNILESIYVLSLTKSNRPGLEENLIKFGEDSLRIEGNIQVDNLIKKMRIEIDKNRKNVFINDKEIRKTRDYISNFCVISFTPFDLEIIKGSPLIRRNLINIEVSQLYNSYINHLNEYNKVLKIRNDYLKKININGNNDRRYLEVINGKIIEKSLKIYYFRFMYIEYINKYIGDIYEKLTNLKGLKIIFKNSFDLSIYDCEIIEKKFIEKFNKNYYQELLQGMTLIGPHRDDFLFELDGKDMKNFASQGQQTMAIIAYKISELYIYKDIKRDLPVLLLDDIFSEIDTRKRNKFISYLNKNNIQVIITTTDINDINEKLLKKAKIYVIKNNKIVIKGGKKNE